MRTIHVLNLGAGVQSTTLYLGQMKGLFDFPMDYAIFADVGEEPKAVYAHVDWMKSLNGPEIMVRTAGKLGDDLQHGRNSTGQRFVSIPVFTAAPGATRATGMLRRQCTKEYKIDVIDRTIRRELLELKPRQRWPKDVHVVQYYGISSDEEVRARRITARTEKYASRLTVKFPLIERGMSRLDCVKWLVEHGGVPHPVPRSACVFCPFHKDEEWMWLKANDPEGWARAVEIDEALRRPGTVCNRSMTQPMYLHRKVQPLTQIQFNPSAMELGIEVLECEGMCGS